MQAQILTACQSGIQVFVHLKIYVIGNNHAIYFASHEAQGDNSFFCCFYCHFFFANNTLPGIRHFGPAPCGR
ncbi:hypothetical protein CFR73_06625 [Novacetimonas maltaceti]|nr:hypothetical protein CFR73_06625 [Novacetimonas maltaceti]